ncbi:MAG TPA: nucleotide disphospho-sugar-binding domain-containing protein [Pseudonocardiaceae bacterium]|nr:nucleotide disphospho-sugar-binding domain-containing protein [Pseudonocardiaceae bacterium]
MRVKSKGAHHARTDHHITRVGHIFPTVSTAWALRSAGHDVIVATGGNHELAAHAGLPVVDAAPGVDFAAVFRDFFVAQGTAPTEGLDFVGRLFATVSREFTDRTVELARRWHPDLVLYTPLQAVGPLVARVAGVPAIMHTIGIGQTAWLSTMLAERFTDEYRRFGVAPMAPTAVLDGSPPSLAVDAAGAVPMRYVPYNGGAVLPPWLLEPIPRPLVTVTLGSVLPRMAGVGALRPFVAAAGSVPADFVVTLGGVDPADFGPLPANVRLVDWVPLAALLAVSAAAIHHGGAGTTLTALHAGLPQLVLPQGADQFQNAAAVAKSGAGAVVRPEELDADRLGELVADGAARVAARAVAAEMATQPAPADVVPTLVELAG